MVTQSIRRFLRQDVAIDLGTANTLVHIAGEGIVFRQPTVIALDESNDVMAIGQRAKEYLGKVPEGIRVVRPLKAGVIEDLDSVSMFITEIVKASMSHRSLLSPKVVVCIPSRLTQVEKKAVLDACHVAGFKRVYLLEEAMAAAIGSGLDISGKRPVMVVDIGGGTTEMAIISQKSYIMSDSKKIGGDDIDEALSRTVFQKYALRIGPLTAEAIKCSLGSLDESLARKYEPIEIAGVDMKIHTPRKVLLDPMLVFEVIQEVVSDMVLTIWESLSKIDDRTMTVLAHDGLMLTGGVSLIPGIADFFSRRLGIPVHSVDAPLDTVVLGAGATLDDFKHYKEVFVN